MKYDSNQYNSYGNESYGYGSYGNDSYGNTDPQSARGLKDYFRWFIRRFWIFLITLFGGFFLGLFIYSNTPETYQSYATIEIKRAKAADAEVSDEEVIRMTGIGEILSASEKLKMPGIYVSIAESHLFANRSGVIRKSFKYPWEKNTEEITSSDLSPANLGAMMREWVGVRWREDTTLMDIICTHSDPEIARDILIGVLQEYERFAEDSVIDNSEDALEYILESSNQIKEKLLALEKTKELYNRCMELSQQIRVSEREISEMEKRYLPKWPPLVEAQELDRILKQQFSSELQQVFRLSEDEKEFWDSNSGNLDNPESGNRINGEIQLVSTRASVLAREIDAVQKQFDNLNTQLKEGNFAKGFATKQFEILQPPNLPGMPIGPNQAKILIQFTAGGAVLGVCAILLLGFLDPTVRTVSDLELLTSVPVVGAIPTGNFKGREDSLALVNDANGPATEAVRSLRAGLTFLGDARERCTFLITSALPGEGKSWVASNLALSFAKQGDRTLLIDADLRRPVHHETFGYNDKSKGLADHLSLGRSLKEVIQRSDLSDNLFLMAAGSRSANPAELLAGKQLPGLLEKLSEYFDRIIIDSAPMIPVSDSLPLVGLAQSVVLVCRIGKTPGAGIKRAVRMINDNGTDPVGVVANGLPRTKTRRGYGYYYGYMGGGNYSYYNETGDPDEEATLTTVPSRSERKSPESEDDGSAVEIK